MALNSVCPAILNSKLDLINSLQGKGLLPNSRVCTVCQSDMTLQKSENVEDGYR